MLRLLLLLQIPIILLLILLWTLPSLFSSPYLATLSLWPLYATPYSYQRDVTVAHEIYDAIFDDKVPACCRRMRHALLPVHTRSSCCILYTTFSTLHLCRRGENNSLLLTNNKVCSTTTLLLALDKRVNTHARLWHIHVLGIHVTTQPCLAV